MADRKEVKYRAEPLPHNSDAERAVLGSALLKSSMANNVISSLEEEDFFEGRHKIIFRVIANLFARRVAIDILTVAEELANIQELDNVGGVKYLQECADSMVAYANLEFYINIVQNQSVLRKMLLTIRKIDKQYMEHEVEDVNDFIIQSESDFKDSIARRKVSSFRTAEEVAKEVKNEIEMMASKAYSSPDKDLIGLTTGYSNLNHFTQGFQPGTLTIIAGRPGLGKTALALNFALNATRYHDVPIAFFSLEMSAELLMRRLVASLSCVDLSKINSGNLGDGDSRLKINGAIKELSTLKLYIDDSSGLRLTDIIAKSKKLAATNPDLGMIFIDYLGLIQLGVKSGKADSRNEEVRKISLALKDLSRELKIPVVVLSQLSRDVEKRDSKRPMLSDLRDSGSIEQDADVVMLLFRGDYYEKKAPKKNKGWENEKGGQMSDEEKATAARETELAKLDGNVSYVEVNVAKNRNGEPGKAYLFFYKSYGRFDPAPKDWEEAMRKYGVDDAD